MNKPLTEKDKVIAGNITTNTKLFFKFDVISALELLKEGDIFSNEQIDELCCICGRKVLYIITHNNKTYCEDCWINHCFQIKVEKK